MQKKIISAEDVLAVCKRRDISVYAYDTVTSTNDEARRLAEKDIGTPALILADAQSAGRGRMGRSFFSPSGTGIYMSLLLRAKEVFLDTVRLTTAASVAVAQAIDELVGIEPQIKWVNDVYVSGRKVCGILCESFMCGVERFVIIGIGINLFCQEFPEELRDIAASLCASGVTREQMAARIAGDICDFYDDLSDGRIMDYYIAHSCVLGKRVTFTEGGVATSAVARSIDELGRLHCETADGKEKILSSGEITLRLE